MTSQGSTTHSQFKRALERRNFILAWTMAAELPRGAPLPTGSNCCCSPATSSRGGSIGPCHAGMRGCAARQSASGKAQLALAALNALPGPGAGSAVQSLAAVCETHGQGREVQVWKRSSVAADDMATAGNLARAPPSLREAGPSLDLVLLLAGVLTTGGKFVPARSAGAVELAEQPTPIAKPT